MDSGSPVGSPAPGWYDDFENPGLLRYWDGTVWTSQTRPRPEPQNAPPSRPPIQSPPQVPPQPWIQPQTGPPAQIQPPSLFQPIAPIQPGRQTGPGRPGAAPPYPQPPKDRFGPPAQQYAQQPGWAQGPLPWGPPPVARNRSRLRGWRLVAVLITCGTLLLATALAVVGVSATAYLQSDSTTRSGPARTNRGSGSTGTKGLPGQAASCGAGTTAKPPGALAPTARATGSPVITPAGAATVLKSLWAARERALAGCDLVALAALDTGSAKAGDVARAKCGCLLRTGAPFSASRIFLPRQTHYPAYFIAEARATDTAAAHDSWTEFMILTRSGPKARWRLRLGTGYAADPGKPGYLSEPVVDSGGYVKAPDPGMRSAASAMGPRLAAFYQVAKNTGKVPANPFLPSVWSSNIPAEIAAHRQDATQASGLRGHFTYTADPADNAFQVLLDAGSLDLTCAVIRVRSVYTRSRLGYPQQSRDRKNWGSELAPGLYRSITESGISQTCFLVPVSGEAALALGGNYRVEGSATGVPLKQ